MIRNFDIAVLRTFVVVAERASMTSAANALHLTQGAVSQQVKRLEDQIMGAIFERSRGGLRLTHAGERLLGHARRVLAANDELCAEMFGNPVEGRVRLGVPFDLASGCMPPILKRFSETHPNVEVSLTCASSPDLLKMLAGGGIDISLAEAPVGQGDGECVTIERLVWVGAQGGVACQRRPLPVSIVADTCAFRPAILEALRAHDRSWRPVFENGSIDATMAAVQADLAVTAWLESIVPVGLEVFGADAGLPDLPPFAINLHVPHSAFTAASEQLAECIRQVLRRSTSQRFDVQQAAPLRSLSGRGVTAVAGAQGAASAGF
jgi:DNA-binding transcriptional LysR family regulator